MQIAAPANARIRPGLGVFGALTASLIFSGAAGLIYQVVWFRVLGLIFGVTVQASSAVLAAFMAGLALGSVLAARYADRLRRPLLVYGIVEVAIGLSGFASLFAFDALQPVYRALAGTGDGPIAAITALRFVLAFLIMLIPTTMMGATLPLVIRGMAQRSTDYAHHVSWLYAFNTFGAIAGAFSAGFYLIGEHGTLVATGVAATFNILIGIGWLLIGRGTVNDPVEARHVVAASAKDRLSPGLARVLLVGYVISGGIALADEVVWTRLLAGIFPGTVYAFSLMLVAILTGIAVGSWAIDRWIDSDRNWVAVFAGLQIAMAITSVLSLAVVGQGYRFEALLRAPLGRDSEQLLLGEPLFMALFALIAIFPTAFLMGVTFPVAAKLYGAGHSDVARRTGHIYGANVVGGLIGSLFGGLVLLPALGVQRTILLLAAGSVLIAVAVLLAARVPNRNRLLLGGLAAYLIVALLTPNPYDQLFASDPHGETTIWYREDADATIRVARDRDGNQIIYVNSDGQNTDAPPELVYHYQLGLLGPLLHPNPREVLVVGLAAGITSGAAAVHPNTNLTVAELHPGIIEAARLFDRANLGLLDRDNVTVLANDGRNHLLLSGKQYDVIESDPMWPTNAGAANVYSQDYYQLASRALKDDGLMVQWIDRSLPEPAYKMMVRTFASTFPYTTLWYHGTMMVGSKQPFRIDRQAIDSKFSDPELKALLDWVGIRSSNDLLREFVAQPDELRAYLGDGPIVTDRNPYIEYVQRPAGERVGADLRWRRVASFLSAREQPGDAIIFGDGAMPALLETYYASGMPTLVLPFDPKGREREAEAIVREFVSKYDRVWFVPWWQNSADVYLERWLNVNGYQVLDRGLGNIRMTLYATPKAEAARRPVDVVYGDTLRLTGWTADRESVPVGDIVRLALDWQAEETLDEDVKVLVQLLDDRYQPFATIDRLPLDSPTVGWQNGARYVDRYGLQIPPGTPPGRYSIGVTLYEASNGARLLPNRPNAPGERLLLGSVTVTPATRTFSAESIDAPTLSTRVYVNSLRLAGYTLDDAPRRPGDFVPVTTYWQLLGDGASRPATLLLGNPKQPIGSAALVAGQRDGTNGAIVRADSAVRVRPGTPAGKADLWLAVEGSDPTYLATVPIVAAPPRTPPTPPRTAIGARFGDLATLVGATVRSDGVDLVWRAERDIPQSLSVFVHVLDANGQIVAQHDSPPANGAAPTSSWLPGEQIGDTHPIATSVPLGGRIVVGLYDPATFARVMAGDADSVTLP